MMGVPGSCNSVHDHTEWQQEVHAWLPELVDKYHDRESGDQLVENFLQLGVLKT